MKYYKCSDCGMATGINHSGNENIPRCLNCQLSKDEADIIEQYDNLHCYDEQGNWKY